MTDIKPRWVTRALNIVGFSVGFSMSGCLQVPKFEEPMVLGGVQVSAEVLNRGARTYVMRCASCHGYDGAGNGPGGHGLAERPTDFKAPGFRYSSSDGLPTDNDLDEVLRNGRSERGMPAWRGMPPDERHAVIQYIKTLSPVWGSLSDAT